MSNNKQFKQYTIEGIENACEVLQDLICRVYINTEKYKEYAEEAKDLCDKSGEFIASKDYEDVNDKLLNRQHNNTMYIAELQKSSFSYNIVQEILRNKNYIKTSIPKEVKEIIDEFRDLRNLTFHNPQSMLVANREVA